MSVVETIGKNIVKARVIRKLSRKNLADALKISESALKSFEHGKKFAGSETIHKIADLLRLPYSFFYYMEDEPEVIKYGNPFVSRKELDPIKELAVYTVSGVPTIVYSLELPCFSPTSFNEFDASLDASELGRKFAKYFIKQKKTLSNFLEELGIYVVTLKTENPLFRGMFIKRFDIPIIVLYSERLLSDTCVEDLAFCIGYVFSENKDVDELKFCSDFSKEFCEYLFDGVFDIGSFDFLKRRTVEAWERGEISGSRAAEILGIKTGDFLVENS